ncbi:thiol-disulfide oxidoreductase DCC family protein [Paraburkholderia humisilvae]|uniref:Thiol-disulfide oxidoreductase DCC n=1 Tax=Paraburkholderia humisilvae TaxID=627669 RepID=A0A6J5E693_9BURK|nr:DUF393 domain-containing protein [Paraburkholderia humisilvae]CAB3761990.1 hypothetical protein LMG29542_04209 [Paraburkholderia humisilvae]
MASKASLTLYFDGNCPICIAEVHRLRRWDQHDQIRFIDIRQPDFDPTLLGVNLAALNRQLHGWTSDGHWVTGIDSIIAAYRLTGQGWRVAPLHAPLLHRASQVVYRLIAQNRMRISRLLRLKTHPSCTDSSCSIQFDSRHWHSTPGRH